ncbi:uncharacterized protein BXZ73DRAFT_111926 [Epithele typhae]|uniref:uncharacterized protein n=1 Tax=Epithele typhae TaxID=378194 RepID=UPI002007862D|nr:uncharacterized protein BXZ73DRAFT_111926 [Epithele typhae]KAH9893899.1 hypothetical protein BXZ73DRAFT_111926 [Epithele typhae]
MAGSSLDTNPPTVDRHITAGGWAVFAIMLISDAVMLFWLFTFVRYIQWFITFPLLLLELLLTTGFSLSGIFTAVFMAWVAVGSGLVGALVSTGCKWGYSQLPRNAYPSGTAQRSQICPPQQPDTYIRTNK